ncbi:mCG1041138 [Mus musculus]|nr:mCG1041138 [Mus musculus]
MLHDIYNWNHLRSALRLLHQCVFTLQPLEQHKRKKERKKERKNEPRSL